MAGSDEKDKGFAEMFAEYDEAASAGKGTRAPSSGDEVSGKVVAIGSETVFVDVGAKTEAVIDRGELTDTDGKLTVEMGDTVTARVTESRDGSIVLRTRIGRGPDAAAELAQAQQLGIPVVGTVAEVNKGGVEVDVSGVRAFCPISQLDMRFVEDASSYIGKRLEFRVTRHEEGRGGKANVVLSRRALLEEEAAKLSAETRATMQVGSTMTGTVTSIKSYGAFVDIGGLEGMLHISELGFGHVDHPNEVLAEGQTIEVQVLKIEQTDDPKRPERIGLSLKALQDDPWHDAVKDLTEGKRFVGTVARTEPFGAFIKLPSGIEGLVHVSEMVRDRRVNHAREVVSVGAEVKVSVMGVDSERRRVALSMTAVEAGEEADQAAAYRPASKDSLGTFADLMKRKLKK